MAQRKTAAKKKQAAKRPAQVSGVKSAATLQSVMSIENWPLREGAKLDFYGSWAIVRYGVNFQGQALVFLERKLPQIYNLAGTLTRDTISATRDNGIAYYAQYEGPVVLDGRPYRRYGAPPGSHALVVLVPESSV